MTLLRAPLADDGVLTSQQAARRGRHTALVDVLLACTPDGGCFMRDGDGALRVRARVRVRVRVRV